MFANILRGIYFFLLTGAVQYIGLQLLNMPASERDGLRIIFCYILPAVLLALAYWQWRKIGVFNRRAWMTQNPAQFSPDLIDCYVRFQGKIVEERPCRLPLGVSECVYYAALVTAEWEVKKKKPSKGMETVRKPLLREQSSEELELADKDCRVYVKVEEFTKSCLGLRIKESTQAHCPPQVKAQENSKYQKYHLTEHFLLHGDSVTAQGRLALNRDGRLFIKPTRRLEFPSFLVVQNQTDKFIRGIADTALNDAWNRRIRVTFLLLNAGLLIYFWH